MYDIVIAGAGPAGSNLARLLSKYTKYKICLIDKRRLDLNQDEKRNKTCGGLLSPDAQHMLSRLGITIPIDVLENPQLFSVRTIDFDNGIDRHYQRYYYNMNREKFDRYLFNLIPDTVDRMCGTAVKKAEKCDDGWEIKCHDGETKILKSRFLVIADGANSVLRNQLFSESLKPKKYISLQKWYPVSRDMPYYTGIFDSEITDYYSWTIQKNNKLIVGTAVPFGENIEERFELLRTKVSDYLEIPLENCLKKEGAFIERTMDIRALKWSSEGLCLIGEAAGATSPTSAEGFSYALKSSLYLAEELKDGFDGIEGRYRKRCRKIALNIIGKHLKSPAMYNRTIRKLVMNSGLSTIKMTEGVE